MINCIYKDKCNHDNIINVRAQVIDSSIILFQTVSVDAYLMYDKMIHCLPHLII